MSSSMAGAKKEQPRMSKNGPRVGHASGQTCSNTEERVAVWDAVAAFVHKQLLVHKGVWIPTFGSFDIISREIRMQDRTVTLCWPVFHLASNLIAVHHLKSCRGSLPVDRKVEPLQCSQVAADASVSWQTVRKCIQSTVSLLSSCLRNGEYVAVGLKDVGVLLIDGLTFQMKFYHDFLEKLSGKANFRRAVRMAPSLLDMGVSRVTPVASLVFSKCLLVLPKFQMELVSKLPPMRCRKSSGSLFGAQKSTEEETLPPLTGNKKVRFDNTPTYIRRLSTASVDREQFQKVKNTLRRESIANSVLPPVWAVPVAPEQPMSCQLQGLEGTESQENLARTRRVKFLDEEGGAEEAQREASCSQEQPSCSRASSSLSLESPDKPNMLALRACDSVRLLRKRVKKIREAQEQPKEMAAARSCGETSRPKQSTRNRSVLLPPIREENESPTEKMAAETSRGEPSLPEEPPVVRSEFLPAIKEGTGSPRGQSPKTKDPPRRKGTHYPR